MTTPGTYTVTVTVTDATGTTSTSTRSIIYDPIPPVITIVSTSPIKVTAAVLSAKDKNGAVGTITYSGGLASLDLTGVAYDPATLNIQALSPAGLSSRNGDINLDGVVDIADALKALRVQIGLDSQPSFVQMLHGDVGPVVNGAATADSRIRMSDVVVILEKIIGMSSW
jgi:PKD repeat protein